MIRLVVGDVVEATTEAVLRPVAADWSAVTPAMRRLEVAAGEAVAAQCERLGELPIGSAAITGAGELAAKFMVHVVVRSAEEPVSVAGVRRALLNGLRRLGEWDIQSASLVPLGTGAGNLDAEEVAELMAPMLLEHVSGSGAAQELTLYVENEYEREAFVGALRQHGAAGESTPDRGSGVAFAPPSG
ncbi:MAG: macro domain-containing protein [Longimicrobiales bacterium]